jgi:PAS domain S-box-containing protein
MSAGNDKRKDFADPTEGSMMDLRRRAEEEAAAMQAQDPESLSPEEAGHLVHELRVHQIELEMQNEELRQTQQELEASRARYFDLYDLAPVSYVTLSEQGAILEANLTAAALLGAPRGALVNRQLMAFILPADQDIYYRHRKRLFEKGQPQSCELGMVRPDGKQFWALLDATVAQDGATGAPLCRVTMSDITERKQAEEALRESEDRFKYIFDHSVIGKSITLPTGEIQVNKAICTMLGYSPEELRNRHWREITHPDDVELSQREADSLLSGEKDTARFVKRCIHKNGSVVWTDVCTSLRRDKQGQPQYFMTSVADITDRKRVEEALRESERKFRAIFDNANDGFISVDTESRRFFNANRRMMEILGYESEGEIEDLTVSDIHPEKDLPYVMGEFEKHARGEISRTDSLPVKRKDGSVVYASVSSSPLTIGEKTHLSCIFRDVTEQKEAEEALRESERHYRLLAENLSDVIWTMGTNLKYTYVSPSVTRLRGYSVEEAMAQPLDENLTPASVETAMRILAEEDAKERTGQYDPNRVVTMEVELSRKDGSTMWAENKISYLRDSDGRITGYLGVTRDISERRKAEWSLRESEEKFRAVFMQSPIGIVLYDGAGARVSSNKACREIFGLPDAGGIKAPSLLDDPVVTEEARQMLREGKVLKWEGPLDLDKAREAGVYDTKRSGIVHVRGVMLALGYGNGQTFAGYMALLEDVSERKKAEEALRESEEKFRAVFMQSPIGLQLFDAEGKNLIVNPACLEIFGAADPSEIKPLSLFDSPFVPESAKEGSRKGEPVTFEVPYDFEAVELMKRYGTPKSGVIHLNVGVTPVRLTKGSDRVIHYLVQVQDVTERKQAEEKIKQQLLELQRWHSVTLDREGRVMDLKQEVNGLLKRLGEPGRYSSNGYVETETPQTECGGKETREERQRP